MFARGCGIKDETSLLSRFTYLRARYYDPDIQSFTTEDTHWNVENMIYGDKEYQPGQVKMPDASAIGQSNSLYSFCLNNPILYTDLTGNSATATTIITAALLGLAKAILAAAGITVVVGMAVATGYFISLWNKQVDNNKQNHIIHGTNGGHDNGWRKMGIDPNDPNAFEKILPLILEAVDKGVRAGADQVVAEGGWIRTIIYSWGPGKTMIVKLRVFLDGVERVSNAWIE